MERKGDFPQFQQTLWDASERYDRTQVITVASMFSFSMVCSSTGVCRVSNAADISKE